MAAPSGCASHPASLSRGKPASGSVQGLSASGGLRKATFGRACNLVSQHAFIMSQALRRGPVMNEGWFAKPVSIAVGFTGEIRNVSSARQAMIILDHHWPDEGTAKYVEARHSCLDVLHGTKAADIAREAFAAAAREARILVE
ncbi:DUF982 domain-containing protein [Mesorhizobium sp. L-8-3]|uniref:DUF982 domain-containing protein n=1 Tax=Mesorhizobium sp. L-8-3 TaxID=2744522 RepID=UPI0019267F2A|nr:DUF982 domain-containing protein [Mesorhizobium sp. L-8-3]